MPPLIEILLTATDQTGPGFASARANLQAFQAALDADRARFAALGAGAQVAGQQVAAGAQTAGQAQTQQATSARTLATAQQSLEQAQLRAALAGQTGAQRVATLSARYNELYRSTQQAGIGTAELISRQTQLARTEEQLTRATQAYAREADRAFAAERRAAAGASGGGAALPRTFAGFTGQGALEAAGALGIATGIPMAVGQLKQLADQGVETQAVLDRTRGSLGAVLGDQQRANRIFAEASQFADRYKLTQQEMAGAIQASSQIIRTSQQPIENIMSTLARLQVLSPEQGLEGAALALRELTSGDSRSLVQRFEIPRDAANEMKKEIQGGADAVQVLGRYLDSVGITNGALTASLRGAAGQQREWNRQVEGLGLAINNVVTSQGWRTMAAGIVGDTTKEIRALQDLGDWIDRIGAKQAQQQQTRQIKAVEDTLSAPLHALARRLGLEETASQSLSRFTEARSERDIRDTATAAALPVSLPPQARFAGFSPGGGAAHFNPGGPATVNHVTVTVQGSLVHQNDIIDAVDRGLREKARQNAYTGGN